MILLGLTGSIAMGKSHVTRLIRDLGVPVFDADRAAHRLFEPGGGAVAAIAARFADVLNMQGGIDRAKLGAQVFGNRAALARLEAIVHPLVRAAEGVFLERQARAGRRLCVLDIPLLFETGGERRVDRVAVVSAHPVLQWQRAMRRPGMTDAKLRAILAKQLPDADKRRRADYVIPSGHDRGLSIASVGAIILETSRLAPRAWPGLWNRHAAIIPGKPAEARP